eukprot:scaffold4912_cov74-Skeletonema_dohrnii-CCMP3373.AAC.2
MIARETFRHSCDRKRHSVNTISLITPLLCYLVKRRGAGAESRRMRHYLRDGLSKAALRIDDISHATTSHTL